MIYISSTIGQANTSFRNFNFFTLIEIKRIDPWISEGEKIHKPKNKEVDKQQKLEQSTHRNHSLVSRTSK